MRIVSSMVVLGLVLGSGCAGDKAGYSPDTYAPGVSPASTPGSASVTNRNLIVTLDASAFGKVLKVNEVGFVILNFPLGHIPGRDQQLSLYRRGLKVGEVKITGPQQDDNTVADVLTGNAEVGDEVRQR